MTTLSNTSAFSVVPQESPTTVLASEFQEQTIGSFRVGQDCLTFVDGDNHAVQVTANHVSVTFLSSDSSGTRWSFCLTWKTPASKVRTKLIQMARLSSDWQGLVAELANEGLFVHPEFHRLFRAYLGLATGSADIPRVRLITEMGFFALDPEQPEGAYGFMLPNNQAILPDGVSAEGLRYFPPFDHPALAAYGSSGTFEAWRNEVAPARGNVLAVFAMGVSLAGVMLQLSGGENAGFHFHGISSSGKTTACQLGMSIWGCAADPQSTHKPTLFQTWAATNNGREVMAASCSGGPMHLDEIGSMPQGVALAIYPLLNGRGKTRMTEFGGMRPQHSWRIFLLSTGELSIHERILQEPQRQAMAGELVRTPDIPVDNLPRDPNLTTEEAQELARTWKRVAAELYGTAGPAFVAYLLENFETLGELRLALLGAVDQAYEDLCAQLSNYRPLQAPHKRALRHFALVLAMLRWAADAVLPFSAEDVDRAVFTVAEAWYAEFPILTEHERLLDSIRTYIKAHRSNIVDTSVVDERQVLGRHTPVLVRHEGKFWLSPEFFQSACGDLLAKRAAKLLDRLGVLHRHGGTDSNHKAKLTIWPRVFGGQRYYALIADKMFAESELAELTNGRPWPGRAASPAEIDEQEDFPSSDAGDEFLSSGLERAPLDM